MTVIALTSARPLDSNPDNASTLNKLDIATLLASPHEEERALASNLLCHALMNLPEEERREASNSVIAWHLERNQGTTHSSLHSIFNIEISPGVEVSPLSHSTFGTKGQLPR